MQVFVAIATRGRPTETRTLLDSLARQTLLPRQIVVVGTEDADVVGLADHPLTLSGAARIVLSDRPGLSVQRNVGLRALEPAVREAGTAFVAFFDDDFRPAPDWLEQAAIFFDSQPDVVGLTGWVLADGITGAAIDEGAATAFIAGRLPPMKHWASGDQSFLVGSAYGCNMAFRERIILENRFDEELPLYSWQEDRDYTGQALRLGRVVYAPGCRGVHLGVKGGRTSGLRFGYSQVANPLYLMRKGTMSRRSGRRFLVRALAANILRTVTRDQRADYPGRFGGNLRAIRDLIAGRCRPSRILEIR